MRFFYCIGVLLYRRMFHPDKEEEHAYPLLVLLAKCVGALWMCMCFLVFASLGHFALDMQNPSNTPRIGAAMIVFACLFIAAFASTWGPVVWGATAELYPPRHRAVCMSLAIGSNWAWVFMIAFFTPFFTSAIDYRYGYVFAGCCLAAAVTVYFFLIESRGRTMEELDTMYLEYVKPWDSKGYVARVKVGRGSVEEAADPNAVEP